MSLRCVIIVGLLSAVFSPGCGGNQVVDLQQCPTISYGGTNVYQLGAELAFDNPVKTAIGTHPQTGFALFGAHPIAVPPAGDLKLTVNADLASKLPTVLYLYGPRDDQGLYGGCVAEAVQGTDGAELTVEIPSGEGGEFLALVGGHPIGLTHGDYTITATCDGDGCSAPTCPVLAGDCSVDVCPAGFDTETVGDLTCPSCSCSSQVCGGAKILVHNVCVCDCATPSPPQPVCGVDGQTYLSQCHADCHEVVVGSVGTCAANCGELTCDLSCDFGLKKVKGCPTCECASACDNASGRYQPVCATDGFTYINKERLECEHAAAVAVAYVGICLPHCPAPACEQSCAFGHMPSAEATCFECECMNPDATPAGPDACTANDAMVCGRKMGPPDFTPGENFDPVGLALRRFRTFSNKCAAKTEGWVPAYGAACPSGLCLDQDDCGPARETLAETLRVYLRAHGLSESGVDPGPKVECARLKFAEMHACVFKPLSECDVADPTSCPVGATCVDHARGPKCKYSCPCLNNPASAVYDPVCGEVTGETGAREPMTWFNTCFAFCFGDAPPVHQGRCCDTRLNHTERRAHLAALQPICVAWGETQKSQDNPGFGRPRLFLDSGCPPPVEACEGKEETCCKFVTPDILKSSGMPEPQPSE